MSFEKRPPTSATSLRPYTELGEVKIQDLKDGPYTRQGGLIAFFQCASGPHIGKRFYFKVGPHTLSRELADEIGAGKHRFLKLVVSERHVGRQRVLYYRLEAWKTSQELPKRKGWEWL